MNYLMQLANRIRDEVPDEKLPHGAADELFLAYAVLARAKGTAVTNEDVHDAWVAWMSTHEPDHEALVPYSELDASTQGEDLAFTKAIRAVATEMNL